MNGRPISEHLLFMLLFFLATLLMATPGYCAKSVSATLSADQFPLDMATVLTITAEGGRSVDINMPEVKNLRFHRRGQSSQIQMINGSFSASISTVYLIEPLAPGKYTIPPITVHCDGEEMLTKPVSFEATAGTAQGKKTNVNSRSTKTRIGSGDASKITFLKVTPAKKAIYPGEVVPVRIEAYFSRRIQANLNSLPALKGDGFILSPLDNKPERSTTTIDDTPYVVLIWNSFLTGIKEGHHKLIFELEAELLIPKRSRRVSPFRNHGFFQDDLFNDFFRDYQSKMVNVVSPELVLETKPLPTQDRPKNFSGAIGTFSMNVTATPTDVEIGEPITLTMNIEGTGNFSRVQEPTFPESKQWKLYTPSAQFQPEATDPNSGIKTFEQAIVPRTSGINEIPSLHFSYFDPTTGEYKQLTSQRIPLTIHGATQQEVTNRPAPSSKIIDKKPQPVVNQKTKIEGLAPNLLAPGNLQQTIQPLAFHLWFILLVTISILILLSLLLVRLYQRHHEKHPELQHRAQMKKCLQKHFTRIEHALKQEDANTFLVACRKGSQELLGLSWQVEGTAITLADLKIKLEPDSCLINIFSMAEQAAYGGQPLTVEEMEHIYAQLKDELGKLI